MKIPAYIVAVTGFAAAALASPQEGVTFSPAASNGTLNSPSNTVRTHAFIGGYTLGRVQVSGTLTSVHANTWRTDSRIRITAPDGVTIYTFQPFTSGTTLHVAAVQCLVLPARGHKSFRNLDLPFFRGRR